MKEIGGYFELELPPKNEKAMHTNGVGVNSGRHALEYILRGLGDKVKRIYLPYYTCSVVLEPIKKLDIQYCFYHINENLEISDMPKLDKGDYLIVNNYFGIKDVYVKKVADIYGEKLIIDNAQAWYMPEIPGIKAIYSPRKFFGLPDGGIALTTDVFHDKLERDKSYDRCSHLLKRIDTDASYGYQDFHNNSTMLIGQPIKRMSALTKRILDSIDYERARTKRRSNFERLHKALDASNRIQIPDFDSFACPMVYPYLTNDCTLRQRLISNKIFVATYWPNVLEWCDASSLDHTLTTQIIPLPIDQRYEDEDMARILKVMELSMRHVST